MKIAMIGHKRIPSREGGVEIVVEELSTRLVEDGNEVVAFNRSGKNVQNRRQKSNKVKNYKGVKIITIPTIDKKGVSAVLYSFNASITALLGHYDILHFHAEGPCAFLWIPHLFHKKIIVTIHGLDWQRAKWGGFASKFIKYGEKEAVKYADEIIVLSKNVEKYFKETYNRDTNFIPNGVNKPTVREANIIKKQWNLEKDSYILFLARLVPEKGLDYLIDAYNNIKTDKKLVIAGGGSDTSDYVMTVKNKVKNNFNIIMTGFVQGNTLEELFSNCFLYCLPSDVEGMPLSLLEAMSYGNKCLVSDIEENTSVVENYGYTFKKSDVRDLTEKLDSLLNDKEENKNESSEKLKKKSHTGSNEELSNELDTEINNTVLNKEMNKELKRENIQKFILDKYNWDEITRKTEELYKKIK